MSTTGKSLTHVGPDKLSDAEIVPEMNRIIENLTAEYKAQPEQLAALLTTLNDLSSFELGRFLIKHKSLSGYWTWYLIQGYRHFTITSPLEKFLLERAPAVIATQQRFVIFQTLLQKLIKSNDTVCSIPCGMMADLFTLDLPENISGLRYVGIDLDDQVFPLATALAAQHQVEGSFEFIKKDAWKIKLVDQFDIVTTNGLNIYEASDDKVVALYWELYSAIKPGGYLICSALTPPPTTFHHGEWLMNQINQDDLKKSAMIFKVILQANWAHYRTSEQTIKQLKLAGFDDNIEIYWDQQRMFPTFLAKKKLS